MEQNQEDLGPTGAWQISHFPRRMREYLVQEAAKQLTTVPELLTRILIAYRDGNLEAPPPSKTGFANDVLDRSIERIAKLAEYAGSIPKEVSTLAFGLIKADLRSLKAESNEFLKQRLDAGAGLLTDERGSNGAFKQRLTHEEAAAEEARN